jgi:hypothetical protein
MTDTIWRARSASDRTEDWPLWYVTKDKPKDHNDLPEAFALAMKHEFPPHMPSLPQGVCKLIAAWLNDDNPNKVPLG